MVDKIKYISMGISSLKNELGAILNPFCKRTFWLQGLVVLVILSFIALFIGFILSCNGKLSVLKDLLL
jgi:hypothetical protein